MLERSSQSGQGEVSSRNEGAHLDSVADDGGRYSNQVLRSRWLNRFMLAHNQIYAHLYRNLINASLISRKSQELKRMLAEQQAKRGIAGERADQLDRSLYVPEKGPTIYAATKCFEMFLFIRFVILTYYLSDSFPQQTLITTREPAGSLKYEAVKFERPISLLNETAAFFSNAQIGVDNHHELSCLRDLETRLNDHYGRFYLWRSSISLDQRNSSNVLFNNEATRFESILEESYVIQVIRKESKIYTYLFACLLISSFAGSIIVSDSPYDISPLVLIYDPQLVAYTIHTRVKRYVEAMRKSYTNYWQCYKLDDESRLICKNHTVSRYFKTTRRFTEEEAAMCPLTSKRVCGKLKGSSQTTDGLDYAQFADYLPTARSQSWRKIVMLMHSYIHFYGILLVLASFLGIWYLFLEMNSEAIANNRQFKAFLQDGNAGVELESENCRLKLNQTLNWDLVRKAFGRTYAAALRWHDEHTYKLQIESYLNSSFPSSLAQPVDQANVDLAIVANNLAPISMPALVHWVPPFVSLILPSVLLMLYLVILFITLADLCFWLIELRYKLNICSVILKHYNIFSNTDKPVQVFGGDARKASSTPAAISEMVAEIANRQSAICGSPAGQVEANATEDELCNVKLWEIANYVRANKRQKDLISQQHAYRLIGMDPSGSWTPGNGTQKFLISTYLDFRLFLDQIDDCRNSINILLSYSVMHALNVVAASGTLVGLKIKICFVMAAFILANMSLVGGGFFQSQCSKLHSPIHSILALCLKGDKVTLHLASLWRRALTDLCGARSKLSFRVYSLDISYTLALEFNLSITSLYIIILDRIKMKL